MDTTKFITAILKEANSNPLLWQKLAALFDTPKEQNIWALFQDDPADMRSMVAKTIQQKLAQNPTLQASLATHLPRPPRAHNIANITGPVQGYVQENTGVINMNFNSPSIGQAKNVGMVNMPNANLSGAHHLEIVGHKITTPPAPATPPPNPRQRLQQMEFEQILILCYDYCLPVYNQHYRTKANLIEAILANRSCIQRLERLEHE